MLHYTFLCMWQAYFIVVHLIKFNLLIADGHCECRVNIDEI